MAMRPSDRAPPLEDTRAAGPHRRLWHEVGRDVVHGDAVRQHRRDGLPAGKRHARERRAGPPRNLRMSCVVSACSSCRNLHRTQHSRAHGLRESALLFDRHSSRVLLSTARRKRRAPHVFAPKSCPPLLCDAITPAWTCGGQRTRKAADIASPCAGCLSPTGPTANDQRAWRWGWSRGGAA